MNQLPSNAEIFIVGDLNVDLSQKKSQSYQTIKSLEHTNGLIQLINNSTRITSKSNMVLDHIYTNSDTIKSSGVLDINVSDHLPIYVICKKLKTETKLVSFKCRKLKYFCVDFYKEKILALNWEKLYETSDPNLGLELLINNIRLVLDRHYPIKDYKNVPAMANWISNEIIELMKQRDNLYKRAKMTKNEDLWQEAKNSDI